MSMFTRITKFQRLDYMQQGFTHIGFSSGIAEMIYTKSHEQLIRELDKLINNLETLNNNPNTYHLYEHFIIKHTSQKMTDNNEWVYDRRGKSYLYKNLIIHLYDKEHTASITAVKI